MRRGHGQSVHRLRRRKQPPMARVGCHRADHVTLQFIGRQRLEVPCPDRQLDPPQMVARAYHEQHLVAPCEPVEQPGERTELPIERAVADADRQVDYNNVRGRRLFAAFAFEQPPDRSMQQIDDERIFAHRLVLVPPVPRIRTENRTDVQRPRQRRFAGRQIAMQNHRGHCGSMASPRGRVAFFAKSSGSSTTRRPRSRRCACRGSPSNKAITGVPAAGWSESAARSSSVPSSDSVVAICPLARKN